MAYTTKPYHFEAKAGDKKAFCTCGESANAPLCDGSHKGTNFSPAVESFTEDKRVSICGCGKTNNQPFCDGAHKL